MRCEGLQTHTLLPAGEALTTQLEEAWAGGCRGGQDNAGQAGMADTQLWWLHSGADRAEPLPQGCPAAGGHRRVPGVRLTLPGVSCCSWPCSSISAAPSGAAGGMPRVFSRAQKVLFQKENCKAGERLAVLSRYVRAQAAGRGCY